MFFTVSNESELRKKLLEIHDNTDDTFDSKSVLDLIERISSLVKSEIETQNGHTDDLVTSLGNDHSVISVPPSLCSLLPKISCELSCKFVWGEDVDASTMEIMKLLSKYRWEAKLAIVLASLAVDYAQFSHATKLYKDNAIGDVVAMLKQIPDDFYGAFNKTKSTFTVITEASIKVTRIIAEFSKLSPKYISNQVKAMAAASDQFPIAVYNITKVVVATTFSRRTEILGQSEISSYAETWDGTRFEKEITRIHEFFQTQLNCCNIYIEEEKQKNFFLELKRKFNGMDASENNQKILQLLFNTKDCLLPLEFGLDDKTSKKPVWVKNFKGKTVLLFISDLDISDNEISILIELYQESRNNPKYQYEIVWLPIVGKVDQDEELEQKFTDLKLKMPWHSLLHLKLLKPAVERYVKEEWHYSKKSMLVALDPQGRVANLNAYQMVLTWGNTGFPFTHSDESDAWRKTQWSLELLVGGIDKRISTWIKDKKVICLYGGPDENIKNFIKKARAVEKDIAAIELEMVYIGEGMSENLTEILTSNRSHYWEAKSTHYFWRRIEGMVRSESHHGAKVSTTKETILGALRNIHRVGRQGNQSWALISQGAGLGTDKMAYGKLEVILRALTEFENWKPEDEQDFVTALNDYLVSLHVCTECNRPIN